MERYMSSLWSVIGFIAVLRNCVPDQFVQYISNLVLPWLQGGKWFSFFRVPQYHEWVNMKENVLYNKVHSYVCSLEGIMDSHHVDMYSEGNSKAVTMSLAAAETVEDDFMGAKLYWTYESVDKTGEDRNSTEIKSFVLKIHKKDKGILHKYLEHVQRVAEETENRKRELKIFTNNDRYSGKHWNPVSFRHPATFQTVALDAGLKNKILRDLDAFVQAKDYYHKLGRAWKRGYLFYGPPGTGKSSMIAAMANHLRYDIYDLELTKVQDNFHLRKLLMQTANKSILVIEDIDCSLDLQNRNNAAGAHDSEVKKVNPVDQGSAGSQDCKEMPKITLSGMLNFIDGLWSSCGEERIIIFTTNHREKLDPALLRPGRMDLHVYFPPCSFETFKILIRNYLDLDDHDMFPIVDKAFKNSSVSLAPAEVAEILLTNKHCPVSAIEAVIEAIEREPTA